MFSAIRLAGYGVQEKNNFLNEWGWGAIMEQMGQKVMDRNFIASFPTCAWFKISDQRERRRIMEANPAEKYKILLVEDERPVREIARLMMQFAGHEVLVAADGAEAVSIFESLAPSIDLVVLDYSLPGMDGLDVMERLREIRKDVRVIISSGYAPGDVLNLAQHKGTASFDGYLQKPFEMSELAVALRDVMKTLPLA
jgi:CheY-like chemotaxis protein